MLLTVTTTSQNLLEMLTAAQKEQMNLSRDSNVRKGVIQVLGEQPVYIENGADATVANSLMVLQNGVYEFEEVDLGDINLIAEGLSNSDVRLLLN